MKKTTKNTSKSINSKKNTTKSSTNKSAYNLDEYRSRKSNSNLYKGESASTRANRGDNPYQSRPYQNPYGTSKSNNNKVKQNPKTTAQGTTYKKTTKSKYTNPYTTNYNPSTTNRSRSNSSNTYSSNNYSTSYENSYSTRYKDPVAVREEIRNKNKISRKEAEQLKRRRKTKYRNQVIMVIIAVMCGVYGSVKLIDMFRYPTVSYQTVRTGIIDNSQEVEGLIVREEQVYTSSIEGDIHYLTGEGQKVKKQGKVCYISKDEELNKLTTQIEQVDNSIYNMQDKREDLSEYQTEIYSLNKSIVSEIKAFNNNRSLDKTNDVYTLRKQLDRIVQTRTDLYVNEPSDRTQTLQQDRLTLTNEMKGYQNVIQAKASGIVSYTIDGQEGKLKNDILKELTFETYEQLLKQSSSINSNKSVGQAKKDEAIYKLIIDDKWKIVSYVDVEQATDIKEGEFYDLIFSEIGNTKIKFQLESKIEEKEKIKLIFTTRDQIIKFLPYRKVEFTIGENKAEGLKVPLSAMVEKNMLRIPQEYIITKDKSQGVMRQSGELVEFVPINIQYKEDEYAYILQDLTNLSSVQINDTIINQETKDKFKVSEVKAVQGVYTINGRYAKFKQIEIILTNKDYAIIKPNSKLKEFDQIISNPKSIREDQLLKFMNIQNE